MYANSAVSIEFWNSKKWNIWIWRGLFNRVVPKSSSLVCIAETTSGNWNGDGWFSCTRRVSPLLLWCTVFCTVAVKWKINTIYWLLIHWHRLDDRPTSEETTNRIQFVRDDRLLPIEWKTIIRVFCTWQNLFFFPPPSHSASQFMPWYSHCMQKQLTFFHRCCYCCECNCFRYICV